MPEGERLGFAGGDGRAGDEPVYQRREQPFKQGGGRFLTGIMRGRFDQHMPWVVALQRRARAGDEAENLGEAVGVDDLEALDPAGLSFQHTQDGERIVRTGDPEPRDGAVGDRGNEA